MRVTLVISSLRGGGAERVTVTMANWWVTHGWAVRILTLSHGDAPPAYRLDPRVTHSTLGDASAEDLAVVEATLATYSEAARRYLVPDTLLLARIRHSVAEPHPDAIISMIDRTNVRVLAATRGLHIPVYVSERCEAEEVRFEAARCETYLHADGLVALSDENLHYFLRRGVRRGRVIQNGVAPASVQARTGESAKADKLLLSLGRLTPQKGYDMLLHAFAKLAGIHPQWRVEIWGIGPMRAALEAGAARLGIGPRVTMPGFTNTPEEVLARADLYVQPSRQEGFPNALCEAMAAGLPVVAFDCSPGVRTIVRNNVDGVLVPAKQPFALAAALDRLMRDDATRARLSARAPEVVQRFSIESMMGRWEALLREGAAS